MLRKLILTGAVAFGGCDDRMRPSVDAPEDAGVPDSSIVDQGAVFPDADLPDQAVDAVVPEEEACVDPDFNPEFTTEGGVFLSRRMEAILREVGNHLSSAELNGWRIDQVEPISQGCVWWSRSLESLDIFRIYPSTVTVLGDGCTRAHVELGGEDEDVRWCETVRLFEGSRFSISRQEDMEGFGGPCNDGDYPIVETVMLQEEEPGRLMVSVFNGAGLKVDQLAISPEEAENLERLLIARTDHWLRLYGYDNERDPECN